MEKAGAKRNRTLPFDDNVRRLIIILAVLLAVTAVTKSSAFVNLNNFQSIGKQLTEYGLMSLGMGICMISGGIDLSTVYVANLSGICAGLIIQSAVPGNTVLGCLAALAVGAVCGLFNGVLISYFHIPPMLATLGSYELFMGISVVLSGGSTVSVNGELELLSGLAILNIPLPFLIFIAATIILGLVMSGTKFGEQVYLTVTSEKAARFAGIHVKATVIKCYLVSGVLSGMAGLISLSRLNSAKADFGTSYTMQTILVAVLGGINPNGGAGKIPGIAFSVIILQILSSYLNQFPAISNYYRDLIWGAALLLVLVFNVEISRRPKKQRRKLNEPKE